MYNMYIVHSRKLAWTPEIPIGERKSLFQTMILRVHVGFQECGIFFKISLFWTVLGHGRSGAGLNYYFIVNILAKSYVYTYIYIVSSAYV